MTQATENETVEFRADYNPGVQIFRLTCHDFGRILAWAHLYEQITDIHGDVFEFGVGWGRDLVILSHLRRLYEPEVPRRMIGFDTFSGVPGDDLRDIDGPKAVDGYNKPPPGWIENQLMESLQAANTTHPSTDGKAVELVGGKVQDTLPNYLEKDQTAIALAFIDYTIYEPTRFTLAAIKDRLPSGAIIGFNQLKTPFWDAEIRALREVFGLRAGRLLRNPFHRYWGYYVVD